MSVHRDRKVIAFLRWLNGQGGVVDADDTHLDRWSGDREPVDTINMAFNAKLAVQRGSDDNFTVHLLPDGALLLSPSPSAQEAEAPTTQKGEHHE